MPSQKTIIAIGAIVVIIIAIGVFLFMSGYAKQQSVTTSSSGVSASQSQNLSQFTNVSPEQDYTLTNQSLPAPP